jgi:small subunit ribosomal protein S1
MSEEIEDFAALLDEYEQTSATAARGPNVGDMVRGRIISIGSEAVFVDLGGKLEGGNRTGYIALRRTAAARGAQAAEELADAFRLKLPVEGLVEAVNKGGFEVKIAGVRAFCPVSQLDTRFIEEPESYIGQRFEFRITKLEPGRGNQLNLVVSRRALLEEENAARAAELRAQLSEGMVVKGTVTAVKDYGAFVDLGGIEGMLHVSELGFRRVAHPSDVLSVGQTVEVQIIKIEKTGDPKRPERIGLSLKSLEKDPWQDLDQRFPVGSRVRGTVVRTQPFGAFVEVAPGVEGLVHISELGAGRRVNHPREVVSVGQEVEATVLSIEPVRRRLSLSMAASSEEAEAPADTPAATFNQPSGSLGTFGDLLAKATKKK